MTTHYERGRLLFEQSRYVLAERELRAALFEDPGDADSRSYLALCLFHQQKTQEALTEAQAGLALHPDSAFAHNAMSIIEFGRKRFAEAAACARQSLELMPNQPWAFGQLAACHLRLEDWPKALEAAQSGLATDPDDADCLRFRGIALDRLGHHAEARAAALEAINLHPENAQLWALKGRQQLHDGKPTEALESFHEALRIDPELQSARSGVVTALKAKNFFYRLLLSYFFWVSSFSSQTQMALLISVVVLLKGLQKASQAFPALAPYVLPIVLVYGVFGFLVWTTDPLMHLTLRLNRFGRLALDRDELAESNWVGGCLLVAVVAGLCWPLTHHVATIALALMALLMMLPISVTYQMEPGNGRKLLAASTACIALLAVFGVVAFGIGYGAEKGTALHRFAVAGATAMVGSLSASMLSTWAPSVLSNSFRK